LSKQFRLTKISNEEKEKIRLVGKRWEILEKLLPPPRIRTDGTDHVGKPELEEKFEPTLTFLAKELKKDASEVSRHLNELHTAELTYYEQKGRAKHWHLTEEGRIFGYQILGAIERIKLFKEQKAQIKVELWKIDQCLEAIDDEGLSEDLRQAFAYRLFDLVNAWPVPTLEKCERLKRAFKSWVERPSISDKIWERKRAMLSVSMARLASDEKTREWVLSVLYPNLIRLLDHETSDIQIWAIRLLGDVARLSDRERKEIVRLFLDTFLNPATKLPEREGEKSKAEGLVLELIQTFGVLSQQEKVELLNELKDKAKSNDEMVKRKAEWLLDRMLKGGVI